MRTYRRIAYEDRCQIRAYLESRVTKAEIARRLNFHKSTISRELKRNGNEEEIYVASAAELKACLRFESCRRHPRVIGYLAELVSEKLGEGWSPEQISGRLRLEEAIVISTEAVYRFIRMDKQNGGRLFELLRRKVKGGASRYQHHFKRTGLNIRHREAIVKTRTRIGDWERDTMHGLKGKRILVCIDRKTRFIKLKKLNSSKALETGQATQELLAGLPVHTITNDNGTEFRDHFLFKCPVYYCDPFKPNQRGSVENVIGLLRQYITNKTDLNNIDDNYVQELENKLNNRPRKCLDYKTPNEVISNNRVALAN